MIDIREFNPCQDCQYKQYNGKCAMAHKSYCPLYEMTDALKTELQSPIQGIPDEWFVEVLRRRGWHGELKHTTIVTI